MHPPSGLTFSIPYNPATDSTRTTAATAFLLNVPPHISLTRLHQFLARPSFAFNLADPDVRDKGCWPVRIAHKHDGQFKLYYGAENHSFTLHRLAVRIWHDEESVLRLLLSKSHWALRLCRNGACFNPAHVVVESRREGRSREVCARAGFCVGHSVWEKCGRGEERRACVFS